MLRAEPLLRIQLLTLASEAQDAALALARSGVFNPAPARPDALAEAPALAYREAWLEATARLDKLLAQCGDTAPLDLSEDMEAPTLADLEELNTWLGAVWNACLSCHDSAMQIEERRQTSPMSCVPTACLPSASAAWQRSTSNASPRRSP